MSNFFAFIYQIERAEDESIWAVFKYEAQHRLSTVATNTTIELFPADTLAVMKDFKFKHFDVETNLKAGWLFNWPDVNIYPAPATAVTAKVGSQASQQPSYINFLNLDSQPWSDVQLTISSHLQENYNQLSVPTANLSSYTALGLLYFPETETFSSATTYVCILFFKAFVQ